MKNLLKETQMKSFWEWSSKFKICFIAQMDGNHLCWKKFAAILKLKLERKHKECSLLKEISTQLSE